MQGTPGIPGGGDTSAEAEAAAAEAEAAAAEVEAAAAVSAAAIALSTAGRALQLQSLSQLKLRVKLEWLQGGQGHTSNS